MKSLAFLKYKIEKLLPFTKYEPVFYKLVNSFFPNTALSNQYIIIYYVCA